jgi:hypothetical protein
MKGAMLEGLALFNGIPAKVAWLFDVTRPNTRGDARMRWWLCAIVLAGLALRFWGLGSIGLHREDEDTSALPVLGLLQTGQPVFPTGMYYARAFAQTYLMAGSVWLFGNSEWSLRLPSALCGVALIFLGWKMGQRFLQPRWNLVLAATLAFMPSLILASQTARMYIFLLASLAAFSIMIFHWERTGRLRDLGGAVALMWIALQFHTLAVFAAFLFFFPPLLHGDAKRFWLALLALAGTLFAYDVVNDWLGQHFPQTVIEGFAVRPPTFGPVGSSLTPTVPLLWGVIAGIAAAGLAVFTASRVTGRWPAVFSGLLVLAAFAAQLLLAHHLAALLLISAAMIVLRHSARAVPVLVVIGAASLSLAGILALWLHSAGIGSIRNIAGVMLGKPSPWVYLRLAEYSLAAVVVCTAVIAASVYRIARRRPIPDVVLWLVLGAWLPLLAVGTFAWNPAPRYTMVALLPVLVATVAGLQWFAASVRRESLLAVLIGGLALINPVAFARNYNAGYRMHPDHVGAAHYVLAQNPGPRAVIVAEDAIVQRYYLPRVDYWLMARESIIDFVRRYDGVVRDIYTGSQIIGNSADLQSLLDRPDRGEIYIIGSGENQEDGRRYMRGAELNARLTSGEFQTVFVGRDGLTKVWKIPAPPRN